jgi:cob(I)alamin adenosyltransferase
MGHRLSKIYTKKGDKGTTQLGTGTAVAKHDIRVAAYGDVDELNSSIGVVLAQANIPENVQMILQQVQHDLFDLGGELCIPNYTIINPEHVTFLEQQLDELNASLPWLKNFILPGGNPPAAFAHMARTICRRAERGMSELNQQQAINPEALRYINRLSDLLFVVARYLARQAGGQEILWESKKSQKT